MSTVEEIDESYKMTTTYTYSPYRSAVMKLSTDDIVELLETYKEHEILYNPGHPKHTDKNSRRAALKHMLMELREKGINIPDITILKKKIKSLKDTYRTMRIKIETSKKNATEEDEIYTPKMKWYSLADSFLRPFVTSQQTADFSESMGIESMVVVKEDGDDSNISVNSKHGDVEEQEPKISVFKRRSFPRKRFIVNESDEEYSCLNNRVETKIETRDKPDACEAFATYVATQMRSLPRARQLLLQGDILNAITKQFLEWENENEHIESTLVYVP